MCGRESESVGERVRVWEREREGERERVCMISKVTISLYTLIRMRN